MTSHRNILYLLILSAFIVIKISFCFLKNTFITFSLLFHSSLIAKYALVTICKIPLNFKALFFFSDNLQVKIKLNSANLFDMRWLTALQKWSSPWTFPHFVMLQQPILMYFIKICSYRPTQRRTWMYFNFKKLVCSCSEPIFNLILLHWILVQPTSRVNLCV